MRHIYLVFAVLLLAANTACAASFDCAKAGTKVEKMICADAELSKLDGELGKVYAEALKESSKSTALKQEQRDWLKDRDKCVDTACLQGIYQLRIGSLRKGTISTLANKDERKTSTSTSTEDIYPPYPDVWGYELPWPNENSRRSNMDVYRMDSDAVFVTYVSSLREWKRVDGTCCDAEFEYSEMIFFSGKKSPLSAKEINSFYEKYRGKRVNQNDYKQIKFKDGNTISQETRKLGSAHCGVSFESGFVSKNQDGKVLARKSILYLRDKPLDSYFNPYCEDATGMGDVFLKKVESGRFTLVPLKDETFIVYDNDGNLIIRFDKKFNTKFSNEHVFLIDTEVIEKIETDLSKNSRLNHQTLDDAIAGYLMTLQRGEK